MLNKGARHSMNRLILGNLLHRPLRSIISIFAVAIEVVMILSIVGLMLGQLNNTGVRTLGIGMDIIVKPNNGTFIQGSSGAPLSIKIADVLRAVPHVTVVSPVNIKFNVSSKVENIYGIDYDSFNALRPFVFISGTPFQGPKDVILDDFEARSEKVKVGDTISVLSNNFRVCGIVEHGKGGRKFIPIATLDDMTGSRDKASAFYVKADKPENVQAVLDGIKALPGSGDLDAMTAEDWFSSLTSSMPAVFSTSMNVVIGIAVVIGFLVIFQSMYTAVLERTREIGILKSLGASRLTIVSVVLRETGVLSITGIVVGISGTYVLKTFLASHFPTLDFEFPLLWVLKGAGIAFIGSLLGAMYPAWKASTKDPIDALAYD
jgi:putative ABC transport system permease protein